MDTAGRYRSFASYEATGSSPTYERLARAIAGDAELLVRLDALPPPKRQPNLLLAACRYLDAPVGDTAETLDFVHRRWTDLRAVMAERSTQTNEPARTAAFVPLLGRIDGPIALIEVGASAGLCLYPDRYHIRYDEAPPVGPPGSPVTITVRTTGPVPVPHRRLDVASRHGIDLNPLDVRNADDMAWLSACVWPEHEQRRARLVAAASVAALDPPTMVRGDLVEQLDPVLAGVPPAVTPVVFHSAVLNYLAPARRAEFVDRVLAHRSVRWFSNEGPGVVDTLRTTLTPPAGTATRAYFVVGDGPGRVAAISDPHGSWLAWGDGS